MKRLGAEFIGVVSHTVVVPDVSMTLLLGDHVPLLKVLIVLQLDPLRSGEPSTV
jgi:hypothetical protein